MNHSKYHRTYHLPWSDGVTSDDKVIPNDEHFLGKIVVVTEKMDGENTSLYHNGLHARSLDSRHHESRAWVKQFWASIAHQIPKNMVIRGENMFAVHSIKYDDLDSYFLGFSIEKDGYSLPWVDSISIMKDLGIKHVPGIYYGEYDRKRIHHIAMDYFDERGGLDKHEGYVIRIADYYPVKESKYNINKWVRKNHVQTDAHWMQKQIKANELR